MARRQGPCGGGGAAYAKPPAAVHVQVAELAREHAQLVLVVVGEHGEQELDPRVAHAQLAHPAQVRHLHRVAARAQRGVLPRDTRARV